MSCRAWCRSTFLTRSQECRRIQYCAGRARLRSRIRLKGCRVHQLLTRCSPSTRRRNREHGCSPRDFRTAFVSRIYGDSRQDSPLGVALDLQAGLIAMASPFFVADTSHKKYRVTRAASLLPKAGKEHFPPWRTCTSQHSTTGSTRNISRCAYTQTPSRRYSAGSTSSKPRSASCAG